MAERLTKQQRTAIGTLATPIVYWLERCLSDIDALEAEQIALNSSLALSRNQTLDAFQRVAQEHNGMITAQALAQELARALRRAVEPYCKSCRGKRTISVKHGMTYITDDADEHALAYHDEPCPECSFKDLLARPDVQALMVQEAETKP